MFLKIQDLNTELLESYEGIDELHQENSALNKSKQDLGEEVCTFFRSRFYIFDHKSRKFIFLKKKKDLENSTK